MIITAINIQPFDNTTAPIDNTQFSASFGGDTPRIFSRVRTTKNQYGEYSLGGTNFVLRKGFPFQILSCGIITPHGIVNGVVDTNISILVNKGTGFDVPAIYENSIPFLPNEYSVDKTVLIPVDDSGYDTFSLGWLIEGEVSTIGLPDSFNGLELEINPFIKINVDERAVI